MSKIRISKSCSLAGSSSGSVGAVAVSAATATWRGGAVGAHMEAVRDCASYAGRAMCPNALESGEETSASGAAERRRTRSRTTRAYTAYEVRATPGN